MVTKGGQTAAGALIAPSEIRFDAFVTQIAGAMSRDGRRTSRATAIHPAGVNPLSLASLATVVKDMVLSEELGLPRDLMAS